MTLMIESRWKGSILVVMCGPFTSEQTRLTIEGTRVRPLSVSAGWEWLQCNNYKYRDFKIPPIGSIPMPHLINEER
jgi:hypothetical protein